MVAAIGGGAADGEQPFVGVRLSRPRLVLTGDFAIGRFLEFRAVFDNHQMGCSTANLLRQCERHIRTLHRRLCGGRDARLRSGAEDDELTPAGFIHRGNPFKRGIYFRFP